MASVPLNSQHNVIYSRSHPTFPSQGRVLVGSCVHDTDDIEVVECSNQPKDSNFSSKSLFKEQLPLNQYPIEYPTSEAAFENKRSHSLIERETPTSIEIDRPMMNDDSTKDRKDDCILDIQLDSDKVNIKFSSKSFPNIIFTTVILLL